MSKKLNVEEILEALQKSKPEKKRQQKTQDKEVKDWTKLKRGDVVQSIRGYGPYFINYYGKRMYRGQYGYYEVDSLDYNGIQAYKRCPQGNTLYHSGRQFIYMGGPAKVDIMNREPHKLFLVKK